MSPSDGRPGNPFLAKPAFSVHSETFYWFDVALAGCLWRDWTQLESEVRERLACLRYADIVEEDDALAEAIQRAADEFRYRLDLIAVDDTITWLADRGLTPDDWAAYIKGATLRQRWTTELAEIVRRQDIPDEHVDDAIWIDAICGDWLARWAEKLAGHAAVQADADEPDELGAAITDGQENCRMGAIPSSLRRADPFCGVAGRLEQRMIALGRLEQTFESFRRQIIVPGDVAEQVQAHYLDWMRIDGAIAFFRGEPQAREAILCASEERQQLRDVATLAGTLARETSLYLGDLPEGLRISLLTARPGQIVGPFEWDGQIAVMVVERKVAPTSQDDVVRRRAEEELLTKALELRVAANVKWASRPRASL